MKRTFFTLLAISLLVGIPVLAQHAAHQHPAEGVPEAKGEMKHDCSMAAQHDEMMAKMNAMDAKVDELSAAMNKAKGGARVDAMAALLTEMVAQRKQMREGMMQMQHKMMSHMSEHMGEAMMKGMKSMADCPMMNPAPPAEKKQ